MNEQRVQNWKAELIVEYAQLENKIATETHKMDTDPNLDALLRDQATLNAEIKLAKEIYTKNIEAAQRQQAGIKAELVDSWLSTEGKTFECNAGSITLRTTRSLIIRNKQKLIEFLTLNKKLSEFIKSFEITKLRKIKDAGLLENEIATWDEKKSISISIKEVEQ